MQIPALVKSVRERVLNVAVMKLPRAMDHFPVLLDLLLRERLSAFDKTMRCNGHDVSRAVRKPDASACKRDLHHVLREVTRGMQHVLVCGSDVASRSVVVSAEVSSDTTSFSRRKQEWKIDLAVTVDDRLCSLDHHLEFQTTFRELSVLLKPREQRGERRDLLRDRDLRERDDEVVRQP